jgi:hypothetical protein
VFLKRLAVFTAVLAIGVAACAGPPGSTVQDPLPHGTALSTSGAAVTGTGVSGITSSLTIAGSGNVNAAESSAPPNSLPAVMNVARNSGSTTQSVKTQATAPNTALVYLSITASANAIISGFPAPPGTSVTFSSPPAGTVYLAYYNGTQWATIGSAGTVSGNTVTFGAVTFNPSITLAAGSSIYLAVYTGGVLATPTPAPTASPTPGPLLNDTGFDVETSAAPIGSAINSTGWTQCTVGSIAAGISYTGGINGTGTFTSATPIPVSTYSPSPGETPLAAIVTAGSQAPAPTTTAAGIPVVAATTTPVHNGNQAALFGGLFNSYASEDVRYSGLCQNITVPAAGAHLSGYVLAHGDEGSTYVQNIVGTLSGTTLTSVLYMENPETATSAGDTAYRAIGPIAVPSGSATLFIGQASRAGASPSSAYYYAFYWWVDGLSLVSP